MDLRQPKTVVPFTWSHPNKCISDLREYRALEQAGLGQPVSGEKGEQDCPSYRKDDEENMIRCLDMQRSSHAE